MLILSLVGRPLMSGQSLVMKKKVFDRIGGFDPTVVHAEDGELAQRAAKHHFRGKIFSQLAVRVSARRFEREGRSALFFKYLWANLYLVLRGPIRSQLFNYKMEGGKS
jgi:GT2 family glycosyltransferase